MQKAAYALSPLLFALSAAPLWAAEPVPRINIGLDRDGALVAATTTLDDGGATLQAMRDGEYGLVLQSPLTVEANLTATVGEDVYAVDLPAGPPPADTVLAFPAMTGDVIELCMTLLTDAQAEAGPNVIPVPSCNAESTDSVGHEGLPPEQLPVSDLNRALPAPDIEDSPTALPPTAGR